MGSKVYPIIPDILFIHAVHVQKQKKKLVESSSQYPLAFRAPPTYIYTLRYLLHPHLSPSSFGRGFIV